MSVLLETSVGDIVIDLLVDQAPKACENFLKLCKIKFYNYCPVSTVQKDFSFQTGDPLGPTSPDSDGGSCIWALLPNSTHPKTFVPEFNPKLKHTSRGTVSLATAPSSLNPDDRLAGSQFIVTLGENLDYLDGRAAVFGQVVEGFDALEKINDAFVDSTGRPLKDIRVRHTLILDDPFPDPEGLPVPPESPLPTPAQLATVRIADDEELDDETDEAALEKLRRTREAEAQALTLEMVGDLPFAEVKPPENVLFVCKLNPVTQDSDLELIFSRFGKILSCEVIRDRRTGDSLQYAFIEFDKQEDCERAYFKMQDVLIDDHRIHVDFSQSVSKLSDSWRDKETEKRKGKRGGWGGIRELEKRRQYRAEEDIDRTDGRYGMVFDREEVQRRKEETERAMATDAGNAAEHKERDTPGTQRAPPRPRSRSRSPRSDRGRGGGRSDRDRDYRSGRDQDGRRDDRRDDRRDYARDNGRHGGRRDDRPRERDRERERERDGRRRY
ncbi:cyclophilin-like protein [Trichodelitschia bisporula]|uniref:Peptidyl-prolyl cis-trans isomerase n=1 Tax=Trichodelitschia bisporula TaxID=703511 RepID=A0A6G1I0L6_9PEZI|nr:cyclophilin-like protein [Trichodelitschia bisporula]